MADPDPDINFTFSSLRSISSIFRRLKLQSFPGRIKEGGGGGEERKETLADKSLDFELKPPTRTMISFCHRLSWINQLNPPPSAAEVTFEPRKNCNLLKYVSMWEQLEYLGSLIVFIRPSIQGKISKASSLSLWYRFYTRNTLSLCLT